MAYAKCRENELSPMYKDYLNAETVQGKLISVFEYDILQLDRMKHESEKGEDEMNTYTMKPQIPFVTSTDLKRTPATLENRKMVEFIDSHKFSFSVDKVTKKLTSSVTENKK